MGDIGYARTAADAVGRIVDANVDVVLRGRVDLGAGHARYLATHITGTRHIELDGEDSWFYIGDTAPILDAVEEFLTGHRGTPEAERALATVLFTDVVDSTAQAARLGDRRWRELLDAHDAVAAQELVRFRGQKVRSTGDGILARFDGPARAIQCAVGLRDAVRTLGLEMRAGLHTGEVEIRGEDIGGITVHIAPRVAAMAAPGEVLVSRTLTDLVAGSGIAFEDRGEHELKGVPGAWRLYAVVS